MLNGYSDQDGNYSAASKSLRAVASAIANEKFKKFLYVH